MTWRRIGYERNYPPEEFNDALRALGGIHRYDENNFRIAWAQTETYIAGGVWSVDECYLRGYRHLLAGSGEPCWTLFDWHAPEEYGTPEAYYVQNYDEASGLQTLGPYPYSGRYEVLFNLRWQERVGDRLELRTMPLSTWLLDRVIPIIVKVKEISAAKRIAAYKDARERDEDVKTARIERQLRSNAIPFKGAVSYTRQGIRSTEIDRKRLELQREWASLSNAAKAFQRTGLQLG